MDRKIFIMRNHQTHVEEPHLHSSHGVLQCTVHVTLETEISDRIGARFLGQSSRPPHLTLVTLAARAVLANAGGKSAVILQKA